MSEPDMMGQARGYRESKNRDVVILQSGGFSRFPDRFFAFPSSSILF